MLIVHPHFHRRRTGITSHVDAIVPALGAFVEARAIGSALDETTPRIRLRELLERALSEDVVWHAHRNLELLAGLQLRAMRPRMRVVVTRHSTTPASRYSRWLARRADARVALTDEVAEALALPAEVIPHGVDVTRFTPPVERNEAARAVGLQAPRGIGVVGRIRPEKGQGDFLQAVGPLLERRPEWDGFLVGQIKREDERWLEIARRAAPRVRLLEPQLNIVPWYRATSILIHPSHREAFSLALLEGLACGCCVVATGLPHHPRIVEHGRTGFLYPPGDVVALREILAELMANPARADAVGKEAARFAREHFGLEREASALAKLYERVLKTER